MREIPLQTSGKTSRILVGESYRNIGKYLPASRLVIITDENVCKSLCRFIFRRIDDYRKAWGILQNHSQLPPELYQS